MLITGIVRLLVGCLILCSCSAGAKEPLLGWHDFTFGLDQAAAISIAKAGGSRDASIDCWDQIGRPPYDSCFLSFSKTIDGADWFVFVYFIPQQGLGKIELRTNDDFIVGFSKFKGRLIAKYGWGTQTDRSRPGTCEELSQVRSAGQSSRYMSWIAPRGFSYRITAEGGTVELVSKEDGLCWNAPGDVKTWFKEEDRMARYLRPTLSIVYERTPNAVYRDRS